MKISEILKSRGFFSKDIKTRFKNNQIMLDGESTSDIDIDLDEFVPIDMSIEDAGVFIFDIIKENKKFINQLKIFGLEGLKNSNIKNSLTDELDKVSILRLSKKETIIIYKK